MQVGKRNELTSALEALLTKERTADVEEKLCRLKMLLLARHETTDGENGCSIAASGVQTRTARQWVVHEHAFSRVMKDPLERSKQLT